MDISFLYKNQDAKHALKYSSVFTLQLRKFCNQFINLCYRYILQAIVTSRDAAHADLTIPDIYQPIRIHKENGKGSSANEKEASSIQWLMAQTGIDNVLYAGPQHFPVCSLSSFVLLDLTMVYLYWEPEVACACRWN